MSDTEQHVLPELPAGCEYSMEWVTEIGSAIIESVDVVMGGIVVDHWDRTVDELRRNKTTRLN